MKKILRKIIPKKIFSFYHFLMALCASVFFGFPSRKLIVIGVTGTKGKTSAINYIWSVLSEGGIKTGFVTTANVKIGQNEMINPFHMTMPGRFKLQGFLRKMVDEGCEVAIIETTSQGIAQSRHIGIEYDAALFTNLTPEHIDSHGSFDNYRLMKAKLFETLSRTVKKEFRGKAFLKTIIANADSEFAPFFLSFDAPRKISFSCQNESDFKAFEIRTNGLGVDFVVAENKYSLSIPGVFNVYNALPAIAIGEIFGIENELIQKGLNHLEIIPGRMEEIKEGQKFRVFVDYAHEKESMTFVAKTANELKVQGGKSIILLGAEGGGRDKSKRAIMGEIAGRDADVVVVSNVDPYEDDPTPIVEDIAVAAEKAGKERGENLFVIEDRREGICKALTVAKEGDIVLLTGKGAEQSMIIGGVTIPWDDREVVREEIRKLL